MKKISRRAVVTTLLVLVAFFGLLAFVGTYLLHAREWVSFPGSPHVYSNGNISTGVIKDRDGVVLLENGARRVYASDTAVRMATIHLLGDRYGRIEAPLINTYAEQLLNYNVVTGMYKSNEEGNVLNLTLSSAACAAALEGLGSRKGTVGVYNYLTGEVLCMVSSGTFDPDDPPDDETIEAYDYYDGVYLDRFTAGAYVPGSIFKLITAAAAIDNISDVAERTFYCAEQEIMSGEYITCEEYHGDISFGTGLVKSCNIVFGELAVELGADVLTRYVEAAGITSSVTFDGTVTESGYFDVSTANEASLAWAGIGQYTNLINPCQFMTFVGSIANGGVAATPYVVSNVQTPDGIRTYSANKGTMLPRTMSASTANTLAQMMRDDVVYNYGSGNFPGLTVCAKSGTAEVDGRNPNAMFAGFIQDPVYPLAFIVVVEDSGSGSATCVPILSKVLDACVNSMKN